MGDLKVKADSLVSRLNETTNILNDQKSKLTSWMIDLKTITSAAEDIEEQNKKLLEENKKLQAELASAKK
jgi:hypothetical protein